MKNYDQAIIRYFALQDEISELGALEYEIIKKLFQTLLKNLEGSPPEFIGVLDQTRAVQKKTMRQQSAAIEGMIRSIIEKLMKSSPDDPELKKLDAKILPLLERMDQQRETFRSAKETFEKILNNLKKSDEAN